MPRKSPKVTPRFLFFSGVEESEKEDIIRLATERNVLPNFKLINLRATLEYEDNVDLGAFLKNSSVFYEKIKTSLEKAVAEKRHIVLTGQPVYKIPGGHIPLFTMDGFASLKPDVLVFYKVEPMSFAIIKKSDPKKILMEQNLNWEYMRTYSLITGAPLRVITVEHGNVKAAIKETYELLKSVLE